MVFYLDASALLKRYVQEAGSQWITALYAPAANHTLATAHITKVEAAAALAAKFRQGVCHWTAINKRNGICFMILLVSILPLILTNHLSR
jgi:predicted nucleic acid-binding protein